MKADLITMHSSQGMYKQCVYLWHGSKKKIKVQLLTSFLKLSSLYNPHLCVKPSSRCVPESQHVYKNYLQNEDLHTDLYQILF